ncbi:hypothetical protein SAVIM338S_00907 [Streptomyces avidinii]
MRKACAISSIAVAAALVIAVPATAASALPLVDPVPNSDTASPSDSASASDKAEAPKVSVTSSPKEAAGYRAGESVTFEITAPSSAEVSAVSDALTGITLTQVGSAGDKTAYSGTGTVKPGWGIGTANLTVTADYGDTGSQSSATFSANADKPTPSPTPSPSDKAEAPRVSITSSPKEAAGYKAGDSVTFQITAPSSAEVSAASDALTGITLTQTGSAGDKTTYSGTGTVKPGWGIGTANLTVTADYGDTGAQGSATFSVNTGTAPSPDPSKPSMSLSTDGGKPGDKVDITINSGDLKGSAVVKSDAFTATVNLLQDKSAAGTWRGRAVISGDTKAGSYRVDGFVGNTKIDSAKFGVAAGSAGNHKVTPLRPDQHKIPKGAVQTGAAPAGAHTAVNTGLVGAAVLGAAALAGSIARRRRHNNSD